MSELKNDQNSDLRKLQLVELEMLKLFADICDRNGLRYYLLGGTLLGALRHQGFIPWDDDIDVCMPRNDYDRFQQIVKETLEEPFYIDSMELNPEYRYCFARIANRTVKIRNNSANIPRVEDAWIDIIPMDGMPEPGLKLSLHKFRLKFWRGMNQIAQYDELVDQKRKRGFIEKVIVGIAGWKIWRVFVNYPSCMSHIRKELCKYDYDNSRTVINFMAAYGFDEVFEKDWFAEPACLKFEDSDFKCPSEYKKVLETIYGNTYMELPPEEDRNKHNAEIIQV